MKVNRENLLSCLERVAPVLVKNPIVPEYGCFHIYDSTVCSRDGDMLMVSTLPENMNIRCLVPGAPLLYLLRNLVDDEVEIVCEGDQLVVTANKVKGVFTVFGDMEKPEVISILSYKMSTSEISDFVNVVGFCRFGASRDLTEPALCGVRVEENKAFACDRYRVIRSYFVKPLSGLTCTIPLKFIDILVKYKKDVESIGRLEEGDVGQTRFVVRLKDGTMIRTSLISGEYRDVEIYFPSTDKFQMVEFDEDFEIVLDRHIGFLKEVNSLDKEIKFDLQKEKCILTSTSGELGTLKEELGMVFPIDEEIGFVINPLFLKDILKKCPGFKYFSDEKSVLFELGNLSYIARVSLVRDEDDIRSSHGQA